ncbi:hypothetical protein [Mucilaginibacter psychrotolerans]|uniref:Uncharacterized protein n=1 Tax=Mucilaginibacter psychrotolerans TaxID=1524096 RepID=A0A4Y8SCJ9_9SPHI|nr:hypothetical protein [Mucilaginibacter psychrotolerans]TFF36320.1 hypothetical protein E2R66_15910 [Mucilaginibacter psychrotolerans]
MPANFKILLALCFSLSCGVACAQSAAQPKADNVALNVTDVKGHTKIIHFKILFPVGPGNTGGINKSNLLTTLGQKLREKGVVCPPKRKKIADNVWICGDGTKYTSDNQKLNALLEELWNESE